MKPELAELAPQGERRMGANPHANGGMLLRDLVMPDFRKYAVTVPSPGSVQAADAHRLGVFLRDGAKLNREQRNFRIFGPDETLSNRLGAVDVQTARQVAESHRRPAVATSHRVVNVVIAGKYQAPQWLAMDAAVAHCTEGIGIWHWAGNDAGAEPDVVMVCCGDVPTPETLAAGSIMREHLPELKVRVINVVDLMKLQPQSEHPHGLSDDALDALFTKDKHVIFAFHGYPWLIHRLTYRRTNHRNIQVRGYKEEGTITTPLDMTVMNDLDRFHLVMDVVDRVPQTGERGRALEQQLQAKLIEHKQYIDTNGQDLPEIRNWKWGRPAAGGTNPRVPDGRSGRWPVGKTKAARFQASRLPGPDRSASPRRDAAPRRVTVGKAFFPSSRKAVGQVMPGKGKCGLRPIASEVRQKYPAVMNLIFLIVVLLLLFGGGGYYFGGPAFGGGGLGLVLLIALVIYLMGGFRTKN